MAEPPEGKANQSPAEPGADINVRLTRLEDALTSLRQSVDALTRAHLSGGLSCYTVVIRPDRLCLPSAAGPGGVEPDRLCMAAQAAGPGGVEPDRLCMASDTAIAPGAGEPKGPSDTAPPAEDPGSAPPQGA
jgi:hypothetical protein